MANLRNIQYAAAKTGLTIIGRVVRGADLYYFDFVIGGNTFVATDSANTRISMPARSAPQDYIYESATFDIEVWDDGFYEFQVYDTIPTPSTGKLLALSRFYIYNGQIMFDDYLVGISTGVVGIKAKTDNLPTDPTSETNATSNKNAIIVEINANETKIDSVKSDTTTIKAKTDNLPVDPTSETNATLNTNFIIAEVNINEAKIDTAQVDITAIRAKTDNLPLDPASQSEVETAISDAEANLVSLLNDISDAIGDIVPNIFAYSVSDTAPVNSFEWYTRYISKQVG